MAYTFLNALHNVLIPFLPNLCQLYHQGIGRGRDDVVAFLLQEAKNNIETKYDLTQTIALSRIISNGHFYSLIFIYTLAVGLWLGFGLDDN